MGLVMGQGNKDLLEQPQQLLIRAELAGELNTSVRTCKEALHHHEQSGQFQVLLHSSWGYELRLPSCCGSCGRHGGLTSRVPQVQLLEMLSSMEPSERYHVSSAASSRAYHQA